MAVLDTNNVPSDADIVVDDCMYEIFFKVEEVAPETDVGDDGNDFDEDDDLDLDENQSGDHEMEDANNQNSSESNPETARGNEGHISSNKSGENTSPTEKEMEIVQEAIDIAVDSS